MAIVGMGSIGDIRTAYQRGVPLERIIAMFMLIQASRKTEILKVDQQELEELTQRSEKIASLLKKLGDYGNKIGMDSGTNKASSFLSQAEIDEVNASIKELGFTDVFASTNEAYIGGINGMQERAINDMIQAARDWTPTVIKVIPDATGDHSDTVVYSTEPPWRTQLLAELKSQKSLLNGEPLTLQNAKPNDIAAFVTKLMPAAATVESPLKQWTATGTSTTGATALEAEFDRQMGLQKTSSDALLVKGALLPTTTGREFKAAVERIQNKLSANSTNHTTKMNDTQNDLSIQGTFQSACRSAIDQFTKTMQEILRGFS